MMWAFAGWLLAVLLVTFELGRLTASWRLRRLRTRAVWAAHRRSGRMLP